MYFGSQAWETGPDLACCDHLTLHTESDFLVGGESGDSCDSSDLRNCATTFSGGVEFFALAAPYSAKGDLAKCTGQMEHVLSDPVESIQFRRTREGYYRISLVVLQHIRAQY